MRKAVVLAGVLMLAACATPQESGGTLRLVDLFDQATAEGSPPTTNDPVAPLEWRFDDNGWGSHVVTVSRTSARGKLPDDIQIHGINRKHDARTINHKHFPIADHGRRVDAVRQRNRTNQAKRCL